MASSALLFALYRKLPAIRSRWQKHRENQRSILMQQQSSDGSTATVSSQGYLKRIGWVIGGLIIILLIANLGNNDSKIAERERIQLCKNMWSSFSGGVASCNSFIESEHMKLVKRYKQLNTNLDRDKYFCSPIKAKNTSNDRIVYCFNLVQENINNRIANNNNSKPTKRNGPSFGQILGLGLGILGGFDAMNNPESYQPYTLPKSKNTPSVNNQYGNKICYYDCLGTIYTLNIDPLGFCPLSASFDNKTCFQK